LLEARRVLSAAVGPDNEQTKQAIEDLANLYDAWRKPAEAARARVRLSKPPG